jgi:hypothetical protein
MKALLYFRTVLYKSKTLFTKENIREMVLGTIIGQAVGWALVLLALSLSGCASPEDVAQEAPEPTVNVQPVKVKCEVPFELTEAVARLEFEISSLIADRKAISEEWDGLEKALKRVRNDNARDALLDNLDKAQQAYDETSETLESLLKHKESLETSIRNYSCE